MHPIIQIFGMRLPLYGIIGIFSVFTLVFLGWLVLYKSDLSVFDGMVLGAYGVLGAYTGSKMLFLIQHSDQLTLVGPADLLLIMRNGGSAYGGILVGLLFGIFGAWIHKIDYKAYVNETVYLLPLCHGIWKTGCHCAGCCYGIPYDGFGGIVFGEKASAPIGVELFPVQIVESVFLFGLFLSLLIKKKRSLSLYLLLYSLGRFMIEFLRNNDLKKMIGVLSDVQYLCLIAVICILLKKYIKGKAYEEQI